MKHYGDLTRGLPAAQVRALKNAPAEALANVKR